MAHTDPNADWPLARRWIYNIPFHSFDVTREDLKEQLETDWEFEDVEILDWTSPVPYEDGYMIDAVEIRHSFGYTEAFAETHGPKARGLA